jgi:hypothetical protein
VPADWRSARPTAISTRARGDENNRDAAGRVPGYAIVDLDARWNLTPALQGVAGAANLFDRRYQNFGQLGANAFNGPERSFGPALGIEPAREQFRAVGGPRTLWIGLRYARCAADAPAIEHRWRASGVTAPAGRRPISRRARSAVGAMPVRPRCHREPLPR